MKPAQFDLIFLVFGEKQKKPKRCTIKNPYILIEQTEKCVCWTNRHTDRQKITGIFVEGMGNNTEMEQREREQKKKTFGWKFFFNYQKIPN